MLVVPRGLGLRTCTSSAQNKYFETYLTFSAFKTSSVVQRVACKRLTLGLKTRLCPIHNKLPVITKSRMTMIYSFFTVWHPRLSAVCQGYLLNLFKDNVLFRVFHSEWYKSCCLFLWLWIIFRSKTWGKIFLKLGHFVQCRIKLYRSIFNFHFHQLSKMY